VRTGPPLDELRWETSSPPASTCEVEDAGRTLAGNASRLRREPHARTAARGEDQIRRTRGGEAKGVEVNVDCAASGSGSYDGSGWLVADTSASVGASGVAGWWVAGLESPQQVATSWVLDSGRQQPCSAEPAVGCGHGHSAGSAPSVARARTAASARLERVPITLL